jgi:hypothetical protein
MSLTSTLTIAAAALVAVATPATADARAFGPLTAGYKPSSGKICVKSGWGLASQQTGRQVRSGDCRNAADWKSRGIVFDLSGAKAETVELAAR